MTTIERPFGRYLEDFEVGDVYKHWPGKTITEYDDHLFCMITMNHHPLHTNAWFAEHETVHGKNVVVGNLVYSLVLGMSVPDVSGAAIANLEVETLQHKFPTFHGDTIYAETRVLEVKESSSKPDRGIVTVETKGFNQHGQEVCYFRRARHGVEAGARQPAQAALRRPGRLGRVSVDPLAAAGFGLDTHAERYERARPSYPAGAVSLLGVELPIGPGRRVLDLARRDGEADPRCWYALGAEVVAVEPLAAMRSQLAAALPTVEALDGSAEAVPLPDASVDAVTVAQAFHWFDAPAALDELARVLRPGGGLALLWNERDDTVPWVAELSRIMHWPTHRPYEPSTDWAALVAASGPLHTAALGHLHLRPGARHRAARRPRGFEQLHRGHGSDEPQDALLDDVRDLVAGFPQPFALPYVCAVHWCHRSSSTPS